MDRRITRRSFVRRAAWAGAGALAAGPACRSRSANDTLDVAVIGVSGRGAVNLDCVASENVVALCDVSRTKLDEAAAKFPRAWTYRDFREMLDWGKIDAVVVTTPDHTHAAATALALASGKHVYCEKPLTHNVREARVIAGLASGGGLATQMGTQMHENYRPAVELVRSGTLGPVSEVVAWTDRPVWTIPKGRPSISNPVPDHLDWDLWLGPAPERPYGPQYQPFIWRAWWDFGTGALGDAACHILDPAFWALDLGLPEEVAAEGPPVHTEVTPEWSIVRSRFPARDDRPAVALTWYEGGKLPPEEFFEGQAVPPQGLMFVGESGKLMVTHLSGNHVLITEDGAEAFSLEDPLKADSPDHHLEWINACKTGGATSCDFARSAVLTEAVLLGNVAYRTGRSLAWDAGDMRSANCPEADQFLTREYRAGWSLPGPV